MKGQGKYPGVVSANIRYGGDGISLTRQEAEKMRSITTHPALKQCLHGVLGCQGTQSLIDWIILSCREGWPNEGDLLENLGA